MTCSWCASTTTQFNSTADRKAIDKKIAEDPQRYGAEYNSEWRDDLSGFLAIEHLEAVTEPGVTVRPPQAGVVYRVFVDVSGGRVDAFTLSIAHREMRNDSERTVVDFAYESYLPNPSVIAAEMAAHLRQYRCSTVTGDNYAAEANRRIV
ncbi:hypothetical protein [Bradyrhizobium sp.]|uniref:hypothetical protein n=1 Tax=Bradyrhizobium sp. TaxID=376 RepID=UPI003BAE79B9